MADKWTPDLPSPLVCKYSWSLTERECDIICFLICLCTQVRRCVKGSYATGEGYKVCSHILQVVVPITTMLLSWLKDIKSSFKYIFLLSTYTLEDQPTFPHSHHTMRALLTAHSNATALHQHVLQNETSIKISFNQLNNIVVIGTTTCKMWLQTTSGKFKSNHKMADKWTPDLPSSLVCKYCRSRADPWGGGVPRPPPKIGKKYDFLSSDRD
jgi:hypothetical protein